MMLPTLQPPSAPSVKALAPLRNALPLPNGELIDAAEYEHLRAIVVGRTPVRAHIVKIDRRASVWVRLPIHVIWTRCTQLEAQPRRHLFVERHLQCIVAGRHSVQRVAEGTVLRI